MKIADIITQLLAVLPRHTSFFNDKMEVTSLSRSADIVTATSVIPHGLNNGDYVFISGVITPITLSL